MVYHIWFIIPYLIITCSFNFQKQFINKYSWKYVLINILVIAVLYFLKVYDVDYKSFTYIQSVFYDTKSILLLVSTILFFVYFFSKMTISDNNLLKWWNNNGYTIIYIKILFMFFIKVFFFNPCTQVYHSKNYY